MGKEGGIEIQAQALLLGPGNPVRVMLRLDFVAIHPLAAKFTVTGVQVQTLPAWDQGKGLLQIGAQLGWGACSAWIVAGDRQSAAQLAVQPFESAHVVALPAVE